MAKYVVDYNELISAMEGYKAGAAFWADDKTIGALDVFQDMVLSYIKEETEDDTNVKEEEQKETEEI